MPLTDSELTLPQSDVGESDQPIPLPNVSSSVLKKASGIGIARFEPSNLFYLMYDRFLNTANITVANLCPQQSLMPTKTRLANARLTSTNGTRNSLPLIRRCCLRSSLPPTISISNRSCLFSLSLVYCSLLYLIGQSSTAMLAARLLQI